MIQKTQDIVAIGEPMTKTSQVSTIIGKIVTSWRSTTRCSTTFVIFKIWMNFQNISFRRGSKWKEVSSTNNSDKDNYFDTSNSNKFMMHFKNRKWQVQICLCAYEYMYTLLRKWISSLSHFYGYQKKTLGFSYFKN